MIGNVVITCPVDGAACEVTVAADGTAAYLATGGMPAVRSAQAALDLPANHGLAAGVISIQPGDSETIGNVVITCPVDGAACELTVAADGTAVYLTTGGMPTVASPPVDPVPGDGPMTAEELIDAVVTAAGDATRSSNVLDKDAEDYVSSGLVLNQEDEFRGVMIADGIARSGFAGIDSPTNFYGGWMEENFFGVLQDIDGATTGNQPAAFSLGNDYDGRPMAGTWEGALTGRLSGAAANAGNPDQIQQGDDGFVRGEVEIQVTTNPNGTADATLAIMDLAGRSDADMAATEFGDMSVTSRGAFSGTIATGATNYGDSTVEGRFYGADGSEVGGVVELDNLADELGGSGAALTGAFGAAKDMPPGADDGMGGSMTAEERIDAVVAAAGDATRSDNALDNDAEDYVSSGLVLNEEDEFRGVMIADGIARTGFAGIESATNFYGGWMKENFFGVLQDVDGATTGSQPAAFSLGNAYGSRPMAGVWEGALIGHLSGAAANVGSPDEIQQSDDGFVRGEVEIRVTTNPDGTADATLAIMDLAGRSAADMAATEFGDMSISSRGAFSGEIAATATNYGDSTVEGRFYGADGSEVGGIVELDTLAPALGGSDAALVGAFGAMPDN